MDFAHGLRPRTEIDMKNSTGVECPEPVEGLSHAYILICADGSYYVGSTNNLVERIKTHNEGRGALWTQKRLPVALVYYENYDTLTEANKRERQLKGWSRIKKENLIKRIWNKQ